LDRSRNPTQHCATAVFEKLILIWNTQQKILRIEVLIAEILSVGVACSYSWLFPTPRTQPMYRKEMSWRCLFSNITHLFIFKTCVKLSQPLRVFGGRDYGYVKCVVYAIFMYDRYD